MHMRHFKVWHKTQRLSGAEQWAWGCELSATSTSAALVQGLTGDPALGSLAFVQFCRWAGWFSFLQHLIDRSSLVSLKQHASRLIGSLYLRGDSEELGKENIDIPSSWWVMVTSTTLLLSVVVEPVTHPLEICESYSSTNVQRVVLTLIRWLLGNQEEQPFRLGAEEPLQYADIYRHIMPST